MSELVFRRLQAVRNQFPDFCSSKSSKNFEKCFVCTKCNTSFCGRRGCCRIQTQPSLCVLQNRCTIEFYCSMRLSNSATICSVKSKPCCFAKFFFLTALVMQSLHLQRYTPLPLILPVLSTTTLPCALTMRISCVFGFICLHKTHILSGIFLTVATILHPLRLQVRRQYRRTFRFAKRLCRT